ncbi:MAG TPA: sialidase family protein [Candidatus Methylomirabilis sp.]|nr:sialidase family protein [Candidatus Methylomirabilis sp.]
MNRRAFHSIRLAFLLIGVAMLVSSAGAGIFPAGPLVQVSGASPFAACTVDNVPGQPGAVFLHSEVEPWIEVDPTNALHLVGGWQQDRWSNGGARGNVAGVSFDGGLTWETVVIPKVTLCSGGTAANGGDFKRATDPWVTFAANGDVYFFTLSLDIEAPSNRPAGFGKNAMLVSKSEDGGLTWGDPITLIRDEDPKFLNDKNSITADPFDADFVYAVWDRLDVPVGTIIHPELVLGFKGPAMFSRTTNGGQSWEPARIIYNPGGNNQTIGNQIVVLPDGTLLNFFNEILNFKNSDKGNMFEFNLALIRSTNKGATWSQGQPTRAAKMQSLALFRAFGVVDPDGLAPTGIRTGDVLFDVAVDLNPGSPGFGNLYAVWQDARFSGFARDEIAFAMSTDGGRTWSAPVKINQTPSNVPSGNRQAFTPSVHVSADGIVGVTYYDFRNNTPKPKTLPTDYFIVHCHQSATISCAKPANWGNEVQLTDASFDMRKAPFARGFFTGDYEGLTASGDKLGALFSMPHGADPASVFFRRVGP